ncbi:hypothetical protein AYI69_g166 [Smittium culicis]|uniref:Uncharacterized protein n=1 Tax=Smittium culicis TaxID=133412 RepID=A0A1R1YTT1_9FUNG|nr:hypothetical protein AYI69_g166 [Smittium culicis]
MVNSNSNYKKCVDDILWKQKLSQQTIFPVKYTFKNDIPGAWCYTSEVANFLLSDVYLAVVRHNVLRFY